MSNDTPRTDEAWGSMHGSRYQMMLLAQEFERELAALQRQSSFNAADSLKWRTMFQNERDENERMKGETK